MIEIVSCFFPNIHGGYELRSNIYSGHMLPLIFNCRMNPKCDCLFMLYIHRLIDFLSYKTLCHMGKQRFSRESFRHMCIWTRHRYWARPYPTLMFTPISIVISIMIKQAEPLLKPIQGAFTDRHVVDVSERYADFQNVNYLSPEKVVAKEVNSYSGTPTIILLKP